MTRYLQYIMLILMLTFISSVSLGSPDDQAQVIPGYSYEHYDQEIQQLFQNVLYNHGVDIKTRLSAASAHFLGRPYLLGSAGEGPNGTYDQSPLYRTDTFDCLTYVNTVVALAKSDNLTQFQKVYKQLNYRDGEPSFTTRNHFTETDWNVHNARKNYVRDITGSIVDSAGKPVAILRQTLIDKPNWFRSFNASQLKSLQPLSPAETQLRLNALRNESVHFSPQNSQLLFLPMTRLFDAEKQPVNAIFAQIPSGSIIEIVKPRPFTQKMGTAFNVSHVGFAIRTQKGLMFREASARLRKVVDVPLVQYLQMNLKRDNDHGINIQEVVNIRLTRSFVLTKTSGRNPIGAIDPYKSLLPL